jgi:Zn-dependent protease
LALQASVPAAARAFVACQAEMNVLLLGFNLLPAFPLDGGRVTRSLLWRRSGDIAAAARLGRGFGYLLIVLGTWLFLVGALGGLWFAIIGVLIVTAAGAEHAHEQVVAAFTGVSVRELMSHPAVTIPSDLTLGPARPQTGIRTATVRAPPRVGRAMGGRSC